MYHVYDLYQHLYDLYEVVVGEMTTTTTTTIINITYKNSWIWTPYRRDVESILQAKL